MQPKKTYMEKEFGNYKSKKAYERLKDPSRFLLKSTRTYLTPDLKKVP